MLCWLSKLIVTVWLGRNWDMLFFVIILFQPGTRGDSANSEAANSESEPIVLNWIGSSQSSPCSSINDSTDSEKTLWKTLKRLGANAHYVILTKMHSLAMTVLHAHF